MLPIVYVCGIHNKKCKPEQGRDWLYYMCPNYKLENRNANENICGNFASVNVISIIENDIQALLDAKLLEIGYRDYVTVRRWDVTKPLQHKKNQAVTIYYEVVDINKDYIKVAITNERVMNNANDI